MICHLRTHRECGCGSKCQQQVEAHVYKASNRDMLVAIVFGIVMALLAAGTLHMLNEYETRAAQEARV